MFYTEFGVQFQVDVPIHVVEGDSMFVTFEGQGFDEREAEPIQIQDGRITVPCTQRIPVPGQVRQCLMKQAIYKKCSTRNGSQNFPSLSF